ncbi:unnamed protein product [Cuscuta campestris]|uniref:Gamma-interferon-inducible lysosomal thiol reductase n=1 Tax=Cuscuta campestris TaxID=132261 RepID=A0A484LJM5_9ASTE|nr:unnamed protein product [Cuscuta campestris]
MAGDDYFISGEVETSETPLVGWITKKNTPSRTRGEFVRGGCRGVGIAKAAKDTKVGVSGWCLEENFMRSALLEGGGGEKIEEMARHVEGFNPVFRRVTASTATAVRSSTASTIAVPASAVALRLSAMKLSAIVLSIATAALLPAACRRTTAALLPETSVTTVAEGGQGSPLIVGSSVRPPLPFEEEKCRSERTPGSRDRREGHVEFVKQADTRSSGHPRRERGRRWVRKSWRRRERKRIELAEEAAHNWHLSPMAAPHQQTKISLLVSLLFFASTSPISSEKVSLDLYYESLCPYSADFIVNYLAQIFENGIIDIVDLTLYPWGNAKLHSNSSSFTCQHGATECFLNTIEVCAIDAWPDVKEHFPFIYCVESLVYNGKYTQWETCYEKSGKDPKPVSDCYATGRGKELELCYAADTMPLSPLMSMCRG